MRLNMGYDTILLRKLKDLRVMLKVSEINTIFNGDDRCYENLKKYFINCYKVHKKHIKNKETIISKLKEIIKLRNDEELKTILKELENLAT
jgi:hypothetical protein